MDKKNRPVGRQKSIGSGSGNVQKRGSGLGSGPVGNSNGYSDRRGSSGRSGSGRSYGGSRKSAGCMTYIVVLLVICYFGYNLYNNMFGGNSESPASSNSFQSQTTNQSSTYDKGEYPVVTSVSNLARPKRTTLKGNGEDKATIMVYMCGTDLETKSGMASYDLQEMLKAKISDNVNIIVETGGTQKWQNNFVNSKTNQRFKLTKDGFKLIEKDLGKKSMVDPATLSDFIKYCKSKYPADRYSLILWDHGGGSLSGYGYDQHYPNDGMRLDEIAIALKNGGCTFDFIGFDACLMATLETAMVLEPYADYMIASEEVEPGIGWYYTGWITALSENTSIPTTELGKKLIDDYVKEVQARTPRSQATLSLIDLAELKGTIPASFEAFAKSTSKLIDSDKYKVVSDARADTKEFAKSSKINQIDLIHFAQNLGTPEAKSFADALRGCIKYNRTSTNITNSNGISIYFPYGNLNKLNSMLETYDQIGINDEYSKCIKSFASVTAGGQIVSEGSDNMLSTLLNGLTGGSQSQSTSGTAIEALLNEFLSGGDYSSITGLVGNSLAWLDVDRIKASINYYKKNRIDQNSLKITEKNGQRVLVLSEEQWDLIQNMEQNVFIDDGEGFIDLGLDNVYEFNDDGDLIMEYDGTWLALNGNIVSYYMISEDRHGDNYSIKGRVPALLNGQPVNIILVFDNENPKGIVLGAEIKYDTSTQTETMAKGLIDINKGDKIDFLCDYYTYAGDYKDTYYLGKQYTATGEWKIENLSVGNKKYQMTYRITDIYNNKYWTPSIVNK
jgi:hypothetical protein